MAGRRAGILERAQERLRHESERAQRAGCTQCGFVEFFADVEAKPVKTLKSVDEENERLRNLVTKLQERVGTLEAIATDPAERTAREIEALRALPDKPADKED